MPNYNWWIDHPELNLEVVGLDLNKWLVELTTGHHHVRYMDGWNASAKAADGPTVKSTRFLWGGVPMSTTVKGI